MRHSSCALHVILTLALHRLATAQDLSQLPTCAVRSVFPPLIFNLLFSSLRETLKRDHDADTPIQQSPSLQSIQTTGCQLTDFACICKDTSYTSSLEPLVKAACSEQDYQRTFPSPVPFGLLSFMGGEKGFHRGLELMSRVWVEGLGTVQFTQQLCGSVGVTVAGASVNATATSFGSASTGGVAAPTATKSSGVSGTDRQATATAAGNGGSGLSAATSEATSRKSESGFVLLAGVLSILGF